MGTGAVKLKNKLKSKSSEYNNRQNHIFLSSDNLSLHLFQAMSPFTSMYGKQQLGHSTIINSFSWFHKNKQHTL